MGEDGADQAAFCAALFDEFVRGGMTEVVVCPGSRSTPLVLAALGAPGLRVHVRLDERSAGFFAIGLALAHGSPVGVVTTSGTAAAELTAAVVEADLAGVGLVALTADRPPELRGVGAPQTIDQVKLFAGRVRRFEEPGVARPGAARLARPLAARVLAAALGSDPGPVHVNLAFVEPLDLAPAAVPPGRAGGRPWRTEHRAAAAPARDAALSRRRVLVVAGRGLSGPRDVLDAADALGWPVLADPLSGCRSTRRCSVSGFDAVLRDPWLRDALRPDAVVQLGAPPASRALAEAVSAWGARLVAVDAKGRPADPLGLVEDVVVADAGPWARAQAQGVDAAEDGWLASWRAADDAVQGAFDEALGGSWSEPALARRLSRELGEDVALVVSSSMPVRDLEWFGAPPAGSLRVLANRGANGIDGVVSTALGVAAAGTAVGLLGDLAFLHDAGALADGLGEAGGCCVLLVADNRGGGIFSFLPQRDSVPPEVFERLFGTPPRVDVASVARGYGCDVVEARGLAELSGAVSRGLAAAGVHVVVARLPDRDANLRAHREANERAARAARLAVAP